MYWRYLFPAVRYRGRVVIEPLDVGFAAVPFVLVGIPTKLGTELRLPWLGTNVRITF